MTALYFLININQGDHGVFSSKLILKLGRKAAKSRCSQVVHQAVTKKHDFLFAFWVGIKAGTPLPTLVHREPYMVVMFLQVLAYNVKQKNLYPVSDWQNLLPYTL